MIYENEKPMATAQEIMQELAAGKGFKQIASELGYEDTRSLYRILRKHRKQNSLSNNLHAIAVWVSGGSKVHKTR